MFKRIGMLLRGLLVVITLIPLPASGTDHLSKKGDITEPDGATKIRVIEGYGKLPLHFEANQGQVDGAVRFLSRGSGYKLFLTSTEVVLTLMRRENNNKTPDKNNRKRGGGSVFQTGTIRMTWEGANHLREPYRKQRGFYQDRK